MQLIKCKEENINNRSQEIAQITRELKLLATNLKSPIIVLSQLNRNIENRINQRPLLSDLRESGCLSYSNIPNIKKHNSKKIIANIKCFKQFYLLSLTNTSKLYETSAQYVYCILNYKRALLYITHNHKILVHKKWTKEDQIKQKKMQNGIFKNEINEKLIIELNKIKKVIKLTRSKVYDITSKEYQNFTVNTLIVHNSIEQDADLILMLYKNKETINEKIIDIAISKHRNGSIGSFQLLFHKKTGQFNDIENKEILPIKYNSNNCK